MSRHLTHRFWWCLLAGLGLAAVATLTSSPALFATALPFCWVLVLSYIEGWWPDASVAGVRLSSHQVIEGDEFEFLVEVEATRPIPWVEVEVQAAGGLRATTPSRFVGPLHGSAQHRVRFTAQRWGVHGPEWINLLTRDRFGLTERLLQVPLTDGVRVHPPTEKLTSLLSLANTRMVTGDHRSRRRGGGTELAEVRPYGEGDPVRNIHTRLSARRGAPYVIDRHPEQASDIVLYVDSVQDIGIDLDTSLRWTVTAAMALGERHLGAMDRVGIIDRGAGVRWLDPAMGRRARHTIVDVLLHAEVLRRRADDRPAVPMELLPKGAAVFAISPLLSTVVLADLAAMRRRGHEVIVVRPDTPVRHDLSTTARRVGAVSNEVRRRALAEVGILVISWDPSQPLEKTLTQADLLRRRVKADVVGAGL